MKKMKLNALESQSLNNKEMNAVRGGEPGDCCACGCNYANQGGSSTNDNARANAAGGLYSEGTSAIISCDDGKTWVLYN
jgi:natural product precursor